MPNKKVIYWNFVEMFLHSPLNAGGAAPCLHASGLVLKWKGAFNGRALEGPRRLALRASVLPMRYQWTSSFLVGDSQATSCCIFPYLACGHALPAPSFTLFSNKTWGPSLCMEWSFFSPWLKRWDARTEISCFYLKDKENFYTDSLLHNVCVFIVVVVVVTTLTFW